MTEVLDEVVAAPVDHAGLEDRVVQARVPDQLFGRPFRLVLWRSRNLRGKGVSELAAKKQSVFKSASNGQFVSASTAKTRPTTTYKTTVTKKSGN